MFKTFIFQQHDDILKRQKYTKDTHCNKGPWQNRMTLAQLIIV